MNGLNQRFFVQHLKASSLALVLAVANRTSLSVAMLFISGDIGGTNCRLQLIRCKPSNNLENPLDETVISEEVFQSQKYSSIITIIRNFLEANKTQGSDVLACCLAVAGPVRGNKCQLTNVNWLVDGEEIQRTLHIGRVSVINDFVAVGYGLLALDRKDVHVINDIAPQPGAPKACLGAGTGLGECFLTHNGHEYDVWPSEGGHTDFAPRDEIEFKVMEHIRMTDRVPRVSVERVVSGLGLPRIYETFAAEFPHEVIPEVSLQLATNEDKGRVIAEFAKSGKCQLCVRALDLFVRAYGAEAGNLALKTLPLGGLYIAGGIAPKVMFAIEKNYQFWNSLINKGRMQTLLERVPVYIVLNPSVGLLGSRVVCRRMIREQGLFFLAFLAAPVVMFSSIRSC